MDHSLSFLHVRGADRVRKAESSYKWVLFGRRKKMSEFWKSDISFCCFATFFV